MTRSLGERLAERIGEITFAKTSRLGLENARRNLPYLTKTIEDIEPSRGDVAVVVAAGPSLHRRNQIALLRESYKGAIIAADGSLGICLRAGVVPDYVVTVDPHAHRIVRWFGDPDLETRPEDDYFRRQDLDPAHWDDEKQRNRELIELVDRHGPAVKCLIATCVDPTVTARCLAAGMPLYWWNPLYDDYDTPGSVSREVFETNQVPCMVTGGNCGTAAWVAAHAVLGKKKVALVGFDFGYPPGTPLERTQYYVEMKEVAGDRFSEMYIPIKSQATGETWYADPTYYWYRTVFLQLVADADCETFNCTEGGTVFGDHVALMSLTDFLRRHAAD